MDKETEVTKPASEGLSDAEAVLALACSEDLLRFLRTLPMVAGQENGQMRMSDLTYEMKLWPFVKQAWGQIKGSPGIPGRLMHLTRVYETAEADFEWETGETRRLPRVIDLPSFIEVYTTVGLP